LIERDKDSDGEHGCNLRLWDVSRDLLQVPLRLMAWFRPMGAAEVAYHEATVVGREDDHPGRAVSYYGSRGETPLRWGGAGAVAFGLSGEVTPEAYGLAFGLGGFRHPVTGEQLVTTRRPGFELVVAAHKSVAVLGVVGHAEEMHSILDVESQATMAWLDDWFRARGGRRGRAQARTATAGLTYAVTRHATSRAGDPSPHDHVLIANVVDMLDLSGEYKALDSAALRDTVEAATMVGRLRSAWRAVALGFRIERDDGPSGRLRHWRIEGVPVEVCELFSKRSDEIAEHLAATGQDSSYRARGIAARASRSYKRHTGPDELTAGWHAELAAAGWPLERLSTYLAVHAQRDAETVSAPRPLTDLEVDALAAEIIDIDGDLLCRHKVFTRTHLVAEVAPRLYGRDPADLDRVLDRICTARAVVPLIGVEGTREQAYTTVQVLEAEHTIARTIEALADRPGPAVTDDQVIRAVASKEQAIGHALTAGQRRVVGQLCQASGAATVVVGVAGSGKTTALDAASTALEAAGYRVLGSSTSGQAARTLGTEAHIESRTLASLLARLDHGTERLDERSVVVVDEAGMADDDDLARLTLAIHRGRAHLVLVGDHRQLAAVGPGGALAALLDRRPDLVASLTDNVRQRDPDERQALAELREGSVPEAVAWYARSGRIHTQPTRIETLEAMVDAWAADTEQRKDTALLAWRRADVEALNRLARHRWDRAGHLYGDDVPMPGGRHYAVGDRIVAVAPDPIAGVVTSERFTVTAIRADAILAQAADGGRPVVLVGEALDAKHLDHAYAVTVHRTQGATYDRAHVLAAGGGRELAYVGLSRARDHTAIHTTADDLDQALDDLQADWGVPHHQRWITETAAQVGWDHGDVERIQRRLDALEQRARTPELDHGLEL
jgi:conjugative relaxase-like TrwC/TraI family protein